METKTFHMIDRTKFISLCKILARKHDLGLVTDYYEKKVIFNGKNVGRVEDDLNKAIMSYVTE